MESWEGLLTGDDEGDPLAFVVNTQGYSGAHFAAFPGKLIEPMILASTSARGCCSKCGSPMERLVKKENPPHDGATKSEYETGSTANRLALARQAARERGEEYSNRTITIGWEQPCKCGVGIVPCRVLDPFGGKGTTGKVAMENGRDATLIELNKNYIPLIEQELHVTAGLALA